MEKIKLREGDKVFYFDGYTYFNIEEVIEIRKPEKQAVLSNQAIITRYSDSDGEFTIQGFNHHLIPTGSRPCVKAATKELEKLVLAVKAKKRIMNYIFRLEHDILKKSDLKIWDRWTEHIQDSLINIAGKLASAMENEPITDEELEILEKELNVHNSKIKHRKSKRL